jgi:hypothetical protein
MKLNNNLKVLKNFLWMQKVNAHKENQSNLINHSKI